MAAPPVMTPPRAVGSPARAAWLPAMNTVGEPRATASGAPAQAHMEPATAAGIPATRTVGTPAGRMGPTHVGQV